MSSKKILFATDYSGASREALEYASWLAKCADACLYIVHVCQREQYPVGELFEEEPEADEEQFTALRAVVPPDSQVKYEHRLLYGEPGSAEVTNPARVIVDFANKEKMDAIVLGTHGRSGFGHLLMGSVAESVLRNATCRVIMVRESKESRKAGKRP